MKNNNPLKQDDFLQPEDLFHINQHIHNRILEKEKSSNAASTQMLLAIIIFGALCIFIPQLAILWAFIGGIIVIAALVAKFIIYIDK